MLWGLDLPLLLTFIEMWQSNTNNFHMRFREMMSTLHNVLYILRIPIWGTQLSSDNEVNYVSQLTSMLKVSDETIRVKCYAAGGFHLDQLLDITLIRGAW